MNASECYMVLSVQQFLSKSGMTPLSLPPYSPDLTQSEFFVCLFPGWMKSSHGNILPMEEVKQKGAEALKGIKINELKTVLSIASSGEYFEGDWSLNM